MRAEEVSRGSSFGRTKGQVGKEIKVLGRGYLHASSLRLEGKGHTGKKELENSGFFLFKLSGITIHQ
jgi:hypothetical protein